MNGERPAKAIVEVPVMWDALEDAFENNSPENHSYLHLRTGRILRMVDGIADPAVHTRVMADSSYLPIAPISSREQYRWMEHFIDTVEDEELRAQLTSAIDGKGAFRRFKDALMTHPEERERWFVFRSEELRESIEACLSTRGVRVIPRATQPKTRNPVTSEPRAEERRCDESGEFVILAASETEVAEDVGGFQAGGRARARAFALVESLPQEALAHAVAFLEFLRERPSLRERRADLESQDQPGPHVARRSRIA